MDPSSSSDEDEAVTVEQAEEDYDLRMFGISRALPVAEGTPDFDAGPPQTAEEYMQWVRHEAMRCPQVVRVEISPERLASVRLATELSQVKLPALRDMQAWGLVCFGPGGDRKDSQQHAEAPSFGEPPGDRPGSEDSVADSPGLDRISGPLLKTVLALDQVQVVSLVTWLIDGLEGMPTISYSRSQWIFALAAALEKPIHCDTGAALRSLLRKCCILRSSLQQKQDPLLPTLNTLIAITGGYFGQDEALARLLAAEELP